jgi:hypothetical protein
VIRFTDNEWNGSSFNAGESVWTWSAGSDIAAGTVVTMNALAGGAPTSNLGTIVFEDSTATGLERIGETIYAITGSVTAPATFLTAISHQFLLVNGTFPGTGLTPGVNALELGRNADIAAFGGTRQGLASFDSFRALLVNRNAWSSQAGDGDQSADGINPDQPFVTDSFLVVPGPQTQTVQFAADSLDLSALEKGLINFFVERTGGTEGGVNFSGTISFGSAGADDFNTLTFNGSIAHGATRGSATIQFADEPFLEPDETFTLTINTAANSSATVQLGANNVAAATILNDDDGNTNKVIHDGEIVAASIEIADADTLTIESGGALLIDDPLLGQAIELRGPLNDASIDNAGTIDLRTDGNAAIYGLLGDFAHDFTILNRATGVIDADRKAIVIESSKNTVAGNVVFDNAGSIHSSLDHAFDIRKLFTANTSVYNRLGGSIVSDVGDGLRPSFKNAPIEAVAVSNDGVIRGFDDAVDFQEGRGVLSNGATGLIESTGQNAISGDRELVVNNDAGGIIRGANGSGINLDTRAGDPATVVNNHGLISGNYNGSGDGDGDGVDVDGQIDLNNWGRIEANGADNIDDFADGIAIGGGSITNRAGGVIFGETRGIFVDNSNLGSAFAATSIVNEGTIGADLGPAIRLVGDWDDVITNKGLISGAAGIALDAGGGGDVFRAYAGSSVAGTIMAGDGNDHISIAGAVTGPAGSAIEGGGGDDRITLQAGSQVNGWVYGGDGNDSLQGADGSGEFLDGGAGDDRLIGGTGAADVLVGGDGNDTYAVGYALGLVVEYAGEGIDTVRASVDYSLGRDVENLSLSGSGDLDGTGNELANALTGNAGANTLSGGAGADRLKGLGGNDTLLGGDGADALAGGEGIDTLTGGADADTFFFQAGYGVDTITDFTAAVDRIDLRGIGGLGSFADVLAHASESAGAVHFAFADLYGGIETTLIIENASIAALNSSDFLV